MFASSVPILATIGWAHRLPRRNWIAGSSLGLSLEGTALEPLIRQLYDELSANGLVFHPPCHVGDEWFVQVGVAAIFVPFLLSDSLRAVAGREDVEASSRVRWLTAFSLDPVHSLKKVDPFSRRINAGS